MNIASHSPLNYTQSALAANASALRVAQPANDHDHTLVKPVGEPTSAATTQFPRRGAYRAEDDSPSINGSSAHESKVESEKQTKKVQEERQTLLEQQQIKELAARDREVRAHEQAHMAVGGQYAGAASYTYERGPNGVSYAVGGEVPISTGREATPEQTIRKAQIVRRAALAPSEPSPADRQVAAAASQVEAEARRELVIEQGKRAEGEKSEFDNSPEVDESQEADAVSAPSEGSNSKELYSSINAEHDKNLAQHYIHSSNQVGSVLSQLA